MEKKERKENKDGICYHTKGPKINVKADWQIKLGVIANTNREDFSSDKEYQEYIEKHTEYAIQEQAEKLKKAWKDLDKQLASTN